MFKGTLDDLKADLRFVLTEYFKPHASKRETLYLSIETIRNLIERPEHDKLFEKCINDLQCKYYKSENEVILNQLGTSLFSFLEFIAGLSSPLDFEEYKEELFTAFFNNRTEKEKGELKLSQAPLQAHPRKLLRLNRRLPSKDNPKKSKKTKSVSIQRYISEMDRLALEEIQGERRIVKKFIRNDETDQDTKLGPLQKMIKKQTRRANSVSSRMRELSFQKLRYDEAKKKENERCIGMVRGRVSGLLGSFKQRHKARKEMIENKARYYKESYLQRSRMRDEISDQVRVKYSRGGKRYYIGKSLNRLILPSQWNKVAAKVESALQSQVE